MAKLPVVYSHRRIWFQHGCAILKSLDNNICCPRGESEIRPAGAQTLVVMNLAVAGGPHPADQGRRGCRGSVKLQRDERCG